MSQFVCQLCKNACCTCSGCHPAVSIKGTQCCTRCIVGVNRTEGVQVQQQVIIPQQDRPNEKLYINGA